MKKGYGLAVGAFALLGLFLQAPAQLTPEDVAERTKWEEFLEKADIVDQKQIVGSEAVTSPWKLTLKMGDVESFALWKGIEVRVGRLTDSWKWEVAAYRLDKLLELNMVPATIERRLKGDRGSLQIWAKVMMSLKDKETKKIKMPSYKVFPWNRALYLQRAFDNLIANEDRHQNNFLITEDWRLILIDHSRSFRTSKKFTESLIYTDKHKEGPREMKELPRALVDKIRALTAESVKAAVGEYLTDEEVAAVITRRDLLLKEIDRIIKAAGGEDKVLY
ncbi:MAG: hypothetical protein A2Y86_02195 [Candidatus Aminicenantes bacterium RBG_13_62_12]|nr:MAG: hypothetical protein A2Y86_02195 [Candidatus Aminicenantes bacterium RBG_13_62_12]